ncbi:hypothetical protein BT96DRAFT_342748 [Gymnopus androsaceus JB14]|uniref:Uncharacterized protein n=1 Tax=Gymnopus androsaceus JB14 TaxID=1447944 RepID=A0A6A4GYD7_9AGAR|nr:hypothetical protein BT96DRAFT_342748 [Gymnopus androsaceus JB14]
MRKSGKCDQRRMIPSAPNSTAFFLVTATCIRYPANTIYECGSWKKFDEEFEKSMEFESEENCGQILGPSLGLERVTYEVLGLSESQLASSWSISQKKYKLGHNPALEKSNQFMQRIALSRPLNLRTPYHVSRNSFKARVSTISIYLLDQESASLLT